VSSPLARCRGCEGGAVVGAPRTSRLSVVASEGEGQAERSRRRGGKGRLAVAGMHQLRGLLREWWGRLDEREGMIKNILTCGV
jgi:hypothetical protein